jgi:uroporphyrin-III C-methyltransferase
MPILTAHDATGHVHLIVGSNPLAGARCTKSIEAGAEAVLIAPAAEQLHYTLAKRVEEGRVEWLKRGFEDADLTTLGRQEVGGVVDAVFVTLGARNALSECMGMLGERVWASMLTRRIRCAHFESV